MLRPPVESADRWTVAESHAAVGIGHDVGRALLSARAHEWEQRLIAELRRLDDDRCRLLATVSHELKNPLGVIVGHVEILQTDPNLTFQVNKSLRALGRGDTRLTTLVDNLLTLSRMDNPERPVDRRPVDLSTVLTEVAEDEAVRAGQYGIELCILSSRGATTVLGDHEKLRRLLTNLVSNTVKYFHPRGAYESHCGPTVRKSSLPAPMTGSASRSRTSGVSPPRSYDRPTLKLWQRPGTGLGLTIVEYILTRYGGNTEVSSEIGVGTTVRARLPSP